MSENDSTLAHLLSSMYSFKPRLSSPLGMRKGRAVRKLPQVADPPPRGLSLPEEEEEEKRHSQSSLRLPAAREASSSEYSRRGTNPRQSSATERRRRYSIEEALSEVHMVLKQSMSNLNMRNEERLECSKFDLSSLTLRSSGFFGQNEEEKSEEEKEIAAGDTARFSLESVKTIELDFEELFFRLLPDPETYT